MSAKTLGLAAILFSCALGVAMRGDTPVADEYEIKAAMFANVLKLVDWPAAKAGDNAGPLVVGVINSDDMQAALQKTAAKMSGARAAGGRAITVHRISGVEGIERCHAVFVGGSDRKRLQTVLQAIGTQAILTVGEDDKFLLAGGMVGLVINDDRIHVEVNLMAAQSVGLSVSSRLLRIATIRGSPTP